MLLTEEDAKTKWCPYARVPGRLSLGDATVWTGSQNRGHTMGGALDNCRCLASKCAGWRWFTETVDHPEVREAHPEIVRFIREHRLIHAIKRRRELTGDGLKESKDYCERLRTIVTPEHPRGYCGAFGEPRS